MRLRALGPGRLSVVHVAPLPPPALHVTPGSTWEDPFALVEGAERWLEDQIKDVEGAEAVVLSDDDPAGAVCIWAAEDGVDLLVVASHRSGIERALLGSFASHLVHNAPCEVVVVRPEDSGN